MISEFFVHSGLTDDIMTVKSYENAAIIEAAIGSIRTGDFDSRVIATATTYTHTMFYEILENVKESLLKLIQRVLVALNNYFLNNVKLVEKYRDVIVSSLEKSHITIKHETYEYPEAKDYPVPIKSTISAEKDIIRLHEAITKEAITSEKVSLRIDKLLQSFGKEVLDESPDPYDLKASTEKIVRKRIRGKKVTIGVTANMLDRYLEQISTYKRDKDDILRVKKNVLDDYEALKRTYASVTKKPDNVIRTKLLTVVDPEKEAFMAAEYSRYASIHVEMMRLFNGYITIYKTAFDTKLNELSAKINDNRNTINEVITRVGFFAALNTKSTMDQKKPIPYMPKT